MDLYPTICDAAGAKIAHRIDGRSILPTLLGKKQKTDDRFLYWEFFERKFQQAVRWRNYKAVRLALDKPLELYDLAQDLAEERDISAESPDVLAKFEAYLKTARTESVNWTVK